MSSSRTRFQDLLSRGEEDLPLAEAALTIAQGEYPLLSPGAYLRRLEEYGQRVAGLLPEDRTSVAGVQALNQILFDEEKFHGNEEDYYDPRNSFLNEVMDCKKGIPISLAVLYMDVAHRAGIMTVGIGLPGHFIVGVPTPTKTLYIDVFHQGKLMTEDDCRQRVERIFGGRMSLSPNHLQPLSKVSILARLLMNLKNIYLESRSFAKAHAVIDRLVLLNPTDWGEVRDRGLVLYQMKQYRLALTDVEAYLSQVPEASDRKDLLTLAEIIGRKIERGEP